MAAMGAYGFMGAKGSPLEEESRSGSFAANQWLSNKTIPL